MVDEEGIEPADLEMWERLRHTPRQLALARPRVLAMYPMPDAGYRRRPPVEIHLVADAESTAAELHAAYGDVVALQVGALAYPSRAGTRTSSYLTGRHAGLETANPAELRIELDGPLSVPS
jgi:hypothetical protein